jgi:hypothetical protein
VENTVDMDVDMNGEVEVKLEDKTMLELEWMRKELLNWK